MGKIFKALEKAEKQTTRRPIPKRAIPEINTKSSVAQKKTSPGQPGKVILDGAKHGMRANTVEHRLKQRAHDILLQETKSTVDSGRQRAQRQNVQRRSDFPKSTDTQSRVEKVRGYVEPLKKEAPSAKPAMTQASESVNITLLKKELAESVATEQPHAIEPQNKKETISTTPTGKPVKVRYSRTKVQVNDPHQLVDNRIFSIFDDFEPTDQIKMLRTQLLRKLKVMGGNSVLITSANPYEGKTFTSINLGVSIAKEFDRTVLIIDADIRKPTENHTAFSTQFFSLQVEKGLTDYLMGDVDISDILINPGIEKLTLIPAGLPVNNAPELLNSSQMETMMAEIKSRYPSDRIVIVDGPALLPFPDVMILSKYVDGVLAVVESERTSVDDLKKMVARLKDVTVFGTVLNKNKNKE